MKLLIIIIIIILFGPELNADFLGWKSLRTRYYTVFFTGENERYALEALNSLEYNRSEVTGLTGSGAANLPVVIEDIGTLSNGLANPVFHNIRLFPYHPHNQWSIDNWMSYVAKHELIHIHHFGNVSGTPDNMRRIFGRLFMPNIFSPGWIYEGIAVYGESTSSPYSGRMNDGYFDTYMRIRTTDQDLPCLLEATYSPHRYPFGEGIYLYGGSFFSYLAEIYSEDKIADFFTHYGGSMLSFLSPLFPAAGLDRSARRTFGKSFPDLWLDWQLSLAKNNEPYELSGTALTDDGHYKDQIEYDDGNVYYSRRYRKKTGFDTMFSFNKIEKINGSQSETVISTTSQIKYFTIKDNDLWYAVYELQSKYPNTFNSSYGYQISLRRKDLASNQDRRILKDEIRTFAITDEGTVLYSKDRKELFGSYLYEFDPESGRKDLVMKSPLLINGIKLYEDRIFVTAKQDWENFSLYELTAAKESSGYNFKEIVRTPYLEMIVAINDGKLFFTANYDGIHSLYYFDLITEAVYKVRGEGLVRHAAYNPDKRKVYVSGLQNTGFDIYERPFHSQEMNLPSAQFKPAIPDMLEDIEVKEGSYFDNLKTLLPAVRMPVFYAGEDEAAAGIYLQGTDAIGHFDYFGELLYDINDERFLANLTFNSNLFLPFRKSLSYNNLDDDQSLQLTVSRPFLRRLQPGVSLFMGRLSARMFDGFERTEYSPGLDLSIRYPGLRGHLSARIPIEDNSYGSNIDRKGLYLSGNLTKYLRNSHLSLAVHGIYDPDNPDTVFPVIKGYTEELDAGQGAVVSGSITTPLAHIRQGLWNPNIFFEDLSGSLFVNMAVPDEGESQAAGGIELVLDGGLFFLARTFWGFRVAYNIEDEFSKTLFFGTNMTW